MGNYSRRVQTALAEDEYRELARLSEETRKPVSALIREAVEAVYSARLGLERRRAALQSLLALDAPVCDWPQMEEEIIRGATEDLPAWHENTDPAAIAKQARAFFERISAVVRELEPNAETILYGSRARGDAAPDSDWDVLVLLDGSVDRAREDAILDRVYDLALETDTVISVFALSREEWASPLYQAMPFHQNVVREGIRV